MLYVPYTTHYLNIWAASDSMPTRTWTWVAAVSNLHAGGEGLCGEVCMMAGRGCAVRMMAGRGCAVRMMAGDGCVVWMMAGMAVRCGCWC